MNISPLSNGAMVLSDTRTMSEVDVALLKKSLDITETNGAMLTKMMEQSVMPGLGENIDIRI